jgi:methionine-rich copper-binding protein CopC
MMGQIARGHLARLLLAGSLLLFVLPAAVDGHAELQTSTPTDGASVTGNPVEISATYSEPMATSGSSLKLVDGSATVIATGGVDPANDLRMSITPVPDLPAGTYMVQSTTTSVADGDIDRKTWTFTVVAAPSATPAPTPVCTDECGPIGSTRTPDPTSTPAASPTPSGGTTPGSGTDVLVPIVAAVVIVAGGAIWFSRRGRRSPGA